MCYGPIGITTKHGILRLRLGPVEVVTVSWLAY